VWSLADLQGRDRGGSRRDSPGAFEADESDPTSQAEERRGGFADAGASVPLRSVAGGVDGEPTDPRAKTTRTIADRAGATPVGAEELSARDSKFARQCVWQARTSIGEESETAAGSLRR